MPSSYRRNSKSAQKVRAKLGLPPRAENPVMPGYPERRYPSASVFANPGETSHENPQERSRRSVAAMGNQAVQGAVEPHSPATSTTQTERVVPSEPESVRRQMRLHELLEPGHFALTSQVDRGGKIRTWAVTIGGDSEEVTDLFEPQRKMDGTTEYPTITRRQPDGKGDDIYLIKGIHRADLPNSRIHLDSGNPFYVDLEYVTSEGGPGHSSYATLDEIVAPGLDVPYVYWDLRPPMPFVELPRMDFEAPTLPPQI